MAKQLAKLAWDRDLERLTDQANRYLLRVAPIAATKSPDADRAVYLVCLSIARKFRGLGIDGVWRAIAAWNSRCEPPWPEDAMRAKVRRACQWVARQPPEQL